MEKSVLKTIVYYDCLDYPLTGEELDTFSFKDKEEISRNLVEESEGFYFLAGRQNLIKKRRERKKIAEKKWERAKKAVWWLQAVPYIRFVFASSSLALGNTTPESDLDVLTVVKSGRIWTSRFLAVVLLGLFGLRRKRNQRVAPDKLCLNHFITDKSLYIPRKSIYTAQLYARLMPILAGDEKLLEDFCRANQWLGEYVAGWPSLKIDSRLTASHSKILNSARKFGEKILDTKFGDWVENVLRKYQLRRIRNYHLTYKAGGRVKADDESLEFHPNSPELRIIERYNQTMVKLGFPELAKEKDSGLTT